MLKNEEKNRNTDKKVEFPGMAIFANQRNEGINLVAWMCNKQTSASAKSPAITEGEVELVLKSEKGEYFPLVIGNNDKILKPFEGVCNLKSPTAYKLDLRINKVQKKFVVAGKHSTFLVLRINRNEDTFMLYKVKAEVESPNKMFFQIEDGGTHSAKRNDFLIIHNGLDNQTLKLITEAYGLAGMFGKVPHENEIMNTEYPVHQASQEQLYGLPAHP